MSKKFCGKTLRQLRRERNVSAAELAKVLGVAAVSTIWQYEQGRNKPRLNHLEKLAEFFSVPVGYFFGETSSQKPKLEFENSVIAWSAEDVQNYVGRLTELFPGYDVTVRIKNFSIIE